jgi:hypothetical protein
MKKVEINFGGKVFSKFSRNSLKKMFARLGPNWKNNFCKKKFKKFEHKR